VGVIPPILEKLAQSVTEFYNEDEYAKYAQEFTKSSHVVEEAIKDFQIEQANIRNELDDYLARVATMKKNIQVDEELFASMKEKEKLAQKSAGKNSISLQEKYQATKESYEAKHEEVARELADLLENKYIDFEPKFTAIVQAQRHLFAKMSNSFELDVLGINSSINRPGTKDQDSGDDEPVSRPSVNPPVESQHQQFTPHVPPRTVRPATNTLVPENPLAPPPRGSSPVPIRNNPGDPTGNRPSMGQPGQTMVQVQASVAMNSVPQSRPTNSCYTPEGKLAIVPEHERTSYEQMFRTQAPTGKMIGPNAFEMFSKSGLPNDQLARVWELSDQDKDGALVMEEFVLAMHIIQSKLRNPSLEIPYKPIPQEYVIGNFQTALPPAPNFFPPPPGAFSRPLGGNPF